MYELRIETVFSAAHAIVMNGRREALHGHDWRVRVIVGADEVDDDGLVCDFHDLQGALDGVVAPFRNANLNETPPFEGVNPTAEHVASHIGRAMMERIPGHARLLRVSITEAPGCEAAWVPGAHDAG